MLMICKLQLLFCRITHRQLIKSATVLLNCCKRRLLKRYGFLPSAGGAHNVGGRSAGDHLASTFNQGLDAGVILDNLALRVQTLESYVSEDDLAGDFGGSNGGPESSFYDRQGASSPSRGYSGRGGGGAGGMPSSPLRNLASGGMGGGNGGAATVGRRLASSRVRRLEDHVYELRTQMQACEADVSEVKSTVLARLGSRGNNGSNGGGSSPFKQHHRNADYHHHDIEQQQQQQEEVRSLQRKVKKLADNTTRACRSLSSGLTDVQQATLNLYAWSDSAHEAFGKVSHQLGLKSNICGRARVYQPPTKPLLAADDLFQDY